LNLFDPSSNEDFCAKDREISGAEIRCRKVRYSPFATSHSTLAFVQVDLAVNGATDDDHFPSVVQRRVFFSPLRRYRLRPRGRSAHRPVRRNGGGIRYERVHSTENRTYS
jgi:hypothetical protein